MKKVILSVAAMLLVSALAVAQSNVSTVTQAGLNNSSEWSQVGNLNVITVMQESLNDGNNEANVEQVGVTNVGSIKQWGDGHFADQTQTVGDGNYAEIYQDRSSNSSTQSQIGSNNVALSGQNGYEPLALQGTGGNNISTQIQKGDDNTSYVAQGTASEFFDVVPAPSYGSSNSASLSQDGFYNFAAVGQINGNNNTAELSQVGGENTSSIGQGLGDYNFAKSTQTGDGHTNTLIQRGSGNAFTVMQSNALNPR
ncbi:MAG: hypothetical protein ACI9L6_001396 [Flavobacterium sp.]|jgi:hypothetical protein